MENIKEFKVFKLKIARQLRQMGFRIYRIEVNRYMPQLNVYIFRDSPEFRTAFTKLQERETCNCFPQILSGH